MLKFIGNWESAILKYKLEIATTQKVEMQTYERKCFILLKWPYISNVIIAQCFQKLLDRHKFIIRLTTNDGPEPRTLTKDFDNGFQVQALRKLKS